MNRKIDSDQIFGFLKKWWLSILLIFCSWFIIKQFWWALRFNVFFAVNYDHVALFNILYFLMDNLTLIIHEAGHTIFGLFGWRFLTILGGTLLQMLIPFAIFMVAWINKQQFTAQFSLYWLGFCWLDSAAYCADAFLRQLPLIGNLPKSAHDFNNMLSMTGLMDSYKTIAWIMFGIGILILLAGILWPLIQRKEIKTMNLDLNL